MRLYLFLLLNIAITGHCYVPNDNDTVASQFPPGFFFSTATAAYQIEGAWNEGGKGENIWDRDIHSDPTFVMDGSNADVACDHYHKYKEDIQLVKNTGFSMFKFSISWSRILPKGTADLINEEGLDHYRDVINEVLRNGLTPMVALYHWDLPQPLQDHGGWLNDTIINNFRDYARVIFDNFGDKVKWWITVNEPSQIIRGYGTSGFAPRVNWHGFGEYIAAHNIIRSHAKAFRLYQREFQPKQKGKVSFSLDGPFVMPGSSSEEDVKAADRAMQFNFGWFGHPVYSASGDYPPIMRETVDKNSRFEGRVQSRLPHFTEEEIKEIRGSYDFLAVNHYTSSLATYGSKEVRPSVYHDSNITLYPDPSWPTSACFWLQDVPEGIRKIVGWFRAQYGNIPILFTENGYCDDGRTEDYQRITYYRELASLLGT